MFKRDGGGEKGKQEKIHFDGFSQRIAEMCNEYNISSE